MKTNNSLQVDEMPSAAPAEASTTEENDSKSTPKKRNYNLVFKKQEDNRKKSLTQRIFTPTPPQDVIILKNEKYQDTLQGYPFRGAWNYYYSRIGLPVFLMAWILRLLFQKVLGVYTRTFLILTSHRVIEKREKYIFNQMSGIKVKSIALDKLDGLQYNLSRNGWYLFFAFLALVNAGIWVYLSLDNLFNLTYMGISLGITLILVFGYFMSTQTSISISSQKMQMGLIHFYESDELSYFYDKIQLFVNQNVNSAMSETNNENVPAGTKQCPHCGGIIKANAIKCRHCKQMIY